MVYKVTILIGGLDSYAQKPIGFNSNVGLFFSYQVSAATAKRLLMHIAGLTSIAQRRSLEAREQLIMMKRKQVGYNSTNFIHIKNIIHMDGIRIGEEQYTMYLDRPFQYCGCCFPRICLWQK